MSEANGLQTIGARPEGVPLSAVDVCICTYRRPAVVDTIASVAAQKGLEGYPVRLIVADNDETDAARATVLAAAEHWGLPVTYVHAPARNISVARNACLDAASAEWIAFLDDDEEASPGWLIALLDKAREGWDAVMGPVDAVYPDGVPDWLRRGDFHSTRPVWVQGRIETGYSGNILLRRSLVNAQPTRFKPELGRSGGEDNDFLYRLYDQGGRIGFAEDAAVREPVPAGRTSLPWLLRRNYRRGQTHGARLRQAGAHGVVGETALALAKGAYCAALAALQFRRPLGRNQYLLRAALHWGVVGRLLGAREISVY